MSENSFDKHGPQAEVLGEYVAVVYAESQDGAERCLTLLETHGIPAVIEETTPRRRRTSGISVLVPDGRLDEASDLLATHEAMSGLNVNTAFDVKDGPVDDDEEADDADDDFDDEEDEEDVDEDDEEEDVFDDDDDDDADMDDVGEEDE